MKNHRTKKIAYNRLILFCFVVYYKHVNMNYKLIFWILSCNPLHKVLRDLWTAWNFPCTQTACGHKLPHSTSYAVRMSRFFSEFISQLSLNTNNSMKFKWTPKHKSCHLTFVVDVWETVDVSQPNIQYKTWRYKSNVNKSSFYSLRATTEDVARHSTAETCWSNVEEFDAV